MRTQASFSKALVVTSFLFATVFNSLAQPNRLEGDFGSGWTPFVLQDRGAAMGVTVQASSTATVNFIFNNSATGYDPKWCGSNAPDQLRVVNTYLAGAAYYCSSCGWDADLQVAVTNTNYYTFVIGKNSTGNNDMSILETTYDPAAVDSVSCPSGPVDENNPVTVTVRLDGSKHPDQKVFIRYTTDNWASSYFIQVPSFDVQLTGTADIPGQSSGTQVQYYALSTNQTSLDHATCDYFTLNLNHNSGINYTYDVAASTGITIVADSTLTEQRLDYRELTLILSGDTFADATLNPVNFTLNHVPAGTTLESVTYVSQDSSVVALAFDGTDFDTDSTHFSVTIAGAELTNGSDLTSNELTIIASDESVYEGIDSAKVAIDNGTLTYWSEDEFDGLDLGTYNSGSTLVLNSGQLFVWKDWSNGGNITACYMYYRIYKDGDTPPSWTQQYLNWFSNNDQGNFTYQLWWNDDPDLTNDNLLSYATTAGTYNIEIYFEADHDATAYYLDNSGNNYIAQFTYELIPALTATEDSVLTEQRLDFRSLTLSLENETFADGTLSAGNFTLNNAPAGTTVESVSYVSTDTAMLALAFDGTDFSSDVTDFSVTIAGAELTGGNALTSNDMTIYAYNESVYEGIDSAKVAIDNGTLTYWSEDEFDGLDLGTYNSGSTLVLNSGQLFVWKDFNNGGDITACYMNYRVYEDGTTPPAFTQEFLPWFSDNVQGNYNMQLWWNDTPDLTNDDLLSYVTGAGTYNVEVYFEAHHDATVHYRNNGGSNYIAQFIYEVPASLTITSDSVLTENRLDFRTLTLSLVNETFADATLLPASFTLNNAPVGTSVESVTYVGPAEASLALAFDGTDFSSNITDFSVTVSGAELTGGNTLTGNSLIIFASSDLECPFEVNLGPDTAICGGSAVVLDPGIMISPYGDSLVITYDATQGQTQLAGASKVYMHSAVELHPFGGWQYITGNWGQDDGVGLMTGIGTDLWQITVNPVNYYGFLSDSAIFGIFMVFRNQDTLTGKDDNGNDIWIDMTVDPPVSSFSGVTATNIPNIYQSIEWSDGSDNGILTVTASGQYWVQITNIDGCISGDTVTVSLGSLPDIEISGDTILCTGTTFDLSISGYETYEWTLNSVVISTDSSITISNGGLYRLTVSNSEGCEGFDVFLVTELEAPVAGYTYSIQSGGTVDFFDSSQNASVYNWDFDNDGTDDSHTAGDVTYAYSTAGQYY
ncbi:MAG: hypothetical protein KJ607_06575, partial [Bacteroidetes bacterium]|nr:hypothetical protein [Bacteroidota bacterium]